MQGESSSADGHPPSLERRLATILMADVAGYSRMMGDDEERTVRTLRGHREIFDALLAMHRGRLFNTAGDSVLAEFPSAVEAVRCATEVQAALRTRNEHLPPEQRMAFRIGINLGDVIVQAGDLLGDGVNVAARIQTVAEPGGICISGSVYDQIQNKLTLQFKPLGEQSFKNIAQPVRTFSITEAQGAALLAVAGRSGSGGRRLLAAGAAAAVIVALGGGYAVYRGYEARVADEARRAADAQRDAETRRQAALESKAEQERNAEQQRKADEDRRAADAQREAKLQAELKAAKDAVQKDALARKAEQERAAADAAQRAADQAALKAREDAAKAAAAAPQVAMAQPPPPTTTSKHGAPTPSMAIDQFDGIYNGRMCNMIVDPVPRPLCWTVTLKVERGAALATWMSPAGKPAYARGRISPQGTVEVTLEGFNSNRDPVTGIMTGTLSGNELVVSGAWQGGLRVNGRWSRAP